MKDYHINIFYSEEDEEYIADIPDLRYWSAFGETPAEALQELEIAKALWLEIAKEQGKAIPLPPIDQHLSTRQLNITKPINDRYILDLLKRIIRVSLETVKIVNELPPLEES